ncbi:MAG TPA: RHS repeat-associated core domain-containing protein, partial [Tahibacter sp.]|nr:RHS repeat-associated core domain-containing protein [Tahibacter sp.]
MQRTLGLYSLAATLWALALPAFATTCREDKGNNECRDLIQLPVKYGAASFANCGAGEPLTKGPYLQYCIYSSNDEMIQYTKTELTCGGDFCVEPTLISQLPYVPVNPALVAFNPEIEHTEPSPDSPFDSEGILWNYSRRSGGMCDPVTEDWTQGTKCEPLVCPPDFQRLVVTTNPRAEVCVRPAYECCTQPSGGGLGGGGRGFGNPVMVPELEKRQTENDADLGPEFLVSMSRTYSSNGETRPAGSHDIAPPKPVAQYVRSVLGGGWRFEFEPYVSVSSGFSTSTTTVRFVRPNGTIRYFELVGTALVGDGDETGVASRVFSGATLIGYQYQLGNDVVETYGTDGRLQSVSRHGLVNLFTYDGSGRLAEIEGYAGRKILFAYIGASPSVSTITLPDGTTISYAYNDQGNVTSATWPSSQVRRYEYDTAKEPQKLARIVDENNATFATFGYDTLERAITTERAGSTNRYAITDLGGMRFRVEGPLGDLHEQTYQLIAGKYRQTDISAKCPTCGPVRKRYYDSTTGLPTRAVDFRQGITDYAFGSRGLTTMRREGATFTTTPQCPAGSTYFTNNYGSACTTGTCWASTPFAGSTSAAPLGYPGQYYSCNTTPVLRTIWTTWHNDFHQPTERKVDNAAGSTETITRWEYNARGQVAAKCDIAPSASSYACSSTTAPPAGADVRRWVYAYCEAADVAVPNSTCPLVGLVKSVNGPRATTDAGIGGLDDVTTYTYYPSTDETGCATVGGTCHRKGDLWTTTNALGHVAENVTYDKSGRVTRSKDVNGTITDLTYHARGWLLTRTVRANANGSASVDDATTTLAYDATGNVTRVTQPDGAYLDYVYDNAHRLTDVADNLGNRLHYTLDAMGNRTKEDTYDTSYNPATPSVGLKRSMSRVYNQLSRLTKTLNASLAPTRNSEPFDSGGLADGYDPNGNDVLSQDGLSTQTRNAYDPLNRLTQTMQDYLGTDPETANATIGYTYDARDNLRTVTDPDALTTTYTYDGLDNLTDLDSPDTGHTDYAYDRAGNRTSQTDNRGVTSTYAYDALNRLTGIAYPTSSLDVTFAYDESDGVTGCTASFPTGKMTRMTDASGSTTYCYDRRGNVTTKTQVTAGKTLVVGYTYTIADRLATLTYPSGGIATYTRDVLGRVTGLTWKADAGATPITVVSNATYLPFGPLNVLTYGNGRTLTKSYDADYAIDKVVSSAVDGLVLDFTTDVMGNIVAASDTVGAATPTRKYIYDKLYRLTRVDDGSNVMQEDYAYNKTGDRTMKQFVGQAAQVYTYLAGTHRLGSVDGAARTYDGNGNTTDRGDGMPLGYDDRNRLAVAGSGVTNTYTYTGKGERVVNARGSFGSGTTRQRYAYDENGLLLAVPAFSKLDEPAGTTEFVYLGATPVAQIVDDELMYFETDHLRTPRIAENRTTNTQDWAWNFFDSTFGEHAATGATVVMLRYPGQVFDDETALHYNYFRDYEASIGRYVESDPIGQLGGINTYGYVEASPLTQVDPFGEQVILVPIPNPDDRHPPGPLPPRPIDEWNNPPPKPSIPMPPLRPGPNLSNSV